ncbi:MAG: LamG domain-containing protein, partial [Prosthecobacter sp.]|nr:LamG domain-containing protein [Prosthecobacter sp.]
MTRTAFCLLALATAFPAGGQNDAAAGNDTSDDHPRTPVVQWRFDDQKEPGPHAPAYPGFPANNTAALSDGKTAVVTVMDNGPEADHPLRFGLNESITLEAWVKVKEISEGSLVYIVGKGRAKGNTKNQNYALRLKGDNGGGKVSFLFASAPVGNKPAGWHRWTSDDGFAGGGWHHIAVAYKFGEPKSIRGYVDGLATKGKWDMDGATDRAPAQDAEEVLLGTGNGGGKGNSFMGWMDDVRIWRAALSEDVLKGRYQFVAPPPVVQRKDVPKGQVLVQICEKGMPERNAWPDEALKATESYTEPAFGFFEELQKYVDTGVRGDRANPHLLRAAAMVTLPKGKHRLLLRGRGASRLYIDNKPILSTPFPSGDGGGHGHVAEQKEYLDLGPDFRFRPPGNREAWCEFESKGQPHFVIMETIVGGYMGKNTRRPELGETVVAWSPQGSESWQMLTPGKASIAYNDAGWEAYAAERSERHNLANAANRAKLRDSQGAYWAKRRAAARQWLSSTTEVPVPALMGNFPANNQIDHFIAAKIDAVRKQMADSKSGTVDYYRDVQPILEARCYDCHQGGKAKGGLKM